MRYKVFVSTDYECETFYCEREQQAHLLFNMAKDSKDFSYVSLSKTIEDEVLMREWGEGDG